MNVLASFTAPVRAKDETFVTDTKIRINGMVRKDKVWLPLDHYGIEHRDEFYKILESRKTVGHSTVVFDSWSFLQYRDLSSTSVVKKALDHYFTEHGVVFPYAGQTITTGTTPVSAITSYMGEIAKQQGYSGWDEYHNWYVENVLAKDDGRGIPEGSDERWPVILSEFEDEGIQDGSHRLHQYILKNREHIPVVRIDNEADKIEYVIESWALRAERLSKI